MARKRRKIKEVKNYSTTTIQELQASRNGGQIALEGFTYQSLYSCYLILSELNQNTVFNLERIEDIDKIEYNHSLEEITHIQIKQSTEKQDASFFKNILKNFLEVFLLDNTRKFKLVYDFEVAKGNMSKLFNYDMDKSSFIYWKGVIEQIKTENPSWNWISFSFEKFISRLTFEKKESGSLAEEIEKKLIKNYDITLGNISLFANGIEIFCLKKMRQRESINKYEIDIVIQNIKDDISKGVQNPAHSWIKRITFDNVNPDIDLSYFEGKKPTTQDIIHKLPVKRVKLENEIKKSIKENRITVIKASSGQGKTTLALQVSYDIQNEYKIYQLSWCNDTRELGNIVRSFDSRVKMGEKPLILIDNLDSQLAEWNKLAQLLQEEITYHYKLILTTREDDWYYYSGDLSNIRTLRVINLTLNECEAQSIYETLRKAKKLHSSILDWRKSWLKVANKELLIEYIYILTHGEMLAERINHQITQISNTNNGKIKCEILRYVCFADICGIKLPVDKLITNLSETTSIDYSELLKSVENEYLIRVDMIDKYVEGLHPVRSQHIVDKLHEFAEINKTALKVIQISDVSYFTKLFSSLPKLIIKNNIFYSEIVNMLWNSNDLSNYVLALQGIFSGSVMQYFLHNKHIFDDANERGGLLLLITELNPFNRFKEFDCSLGILDEFKKNMSDNVNIQYLCELRDTIPKIILAETDIYHLCEALYNKLKNYELFDITTDISSYSSIVYWLINIYPAFNLSKNISLEKIWENKDKCSIDVLSSIMYSCFCENKECYMIFVKANLTNILIYLKESTKSIKLIADENKNEIHVEYILLPSNIGKGNEESVSRLTTICRMLPIFDIYCANSLKPVVEMFSRYEIHDDSHKTIPIRNLFIMFHQEFSSLWSKTIISNYEFDTIFEWLEYWFSIRKSLITLFQKYFTCICKLLEKKQLGNIAIEVDDLRKDIIGKLIKESKYPNEGKPFGEKIKMLEYVNNSKSEYFKSIFNFLNQFVGFLSRDINESRLALINIRTAHSSLEIMQNSFRDISNEQGFFQQQHLELSTLEEQSLRCLLIACLYFNEHQPSMYFSKYQIKSWYKENNKNAMEKAKNILFGLSEKYNVIFPIKYYYDGILSFYPIIVHNLNMTDGELLKEFLCNCIPFTELEYYYLIVVIINDQGKVLPSVLKIPKDFFIKLKKIINTDDVILEEQLTPPFPEEITIKILDCFESKYEIFSYVDTRYEGIDRIAELLWALSKSHNELSDEIDTRYRNHIESYYKNEIKNYLSALEPRIPQTEFDDISQICNGVFNEYKFDDISFNIFFNNLINKHLE